MYVEITDLGELAAANMQLAKTLKKEFRHRRTRSIGFPSGHMVQSVWFSKASGNDVTWWYAGDTDSGRGAMNLFGHGDPSVNSSLNIDLQFNFPIKKFTRSHGGVFFRDRDTNELFLGHRAIVTRGKSRVPKQLLLDEADVGVETLFDSLGKEIGEVWTVAPVGKNAIGPYIDAFVTEVRRAADVVVNHSGNHNGGTTGTTKGGNRKSSIFKTRIREYFDEFSGKSTSKKREKVTSNVRHGAVVRALREAFDGIGKHHKSVEIDLAVETSTKVALFEVKANAGTQAIYTGIGQLYLHSAALGSMFRRKKFSRYLVIPSKISQSDQQRISEELGIHIVSYEDDGRTVDIDSKHIATVRENLRR